MHIAIETIRTVAQLAQDDPAPEAVGATGRAALDGLWPRLAQLVARLLATGATGGKNPPSIPPFTKGGSLMQIIAQALATLLPLLNLDGRPTDPGTELAGKDKARVDFLRRERADRARHRARPDRPPESRSFPGFGNGGDAEPEADVWNDLLELISEALEAFIRFGDRTGIDRCAELLDLLAETFGVTQPEAA